MTVEELFDFSTTSHFGENPDKEIQAEVLLSLLTPKKSMPYYRGWGTDLQRSENMPITLSGYIRLITQAVESVQKYNDDINSKIERRVAIDGEEIEIMVDDERNGELSMDVMYIPLKDFLSVRTGTSVV